MDIEDTSKRRVPSTGRLQTVRTEAGMRKPDTNQSVVESGAKSLELPAPEAI